MYTLLLTDNNKVLPLPFTHCRKSLPGNKAFKFSTVSSTLIVHVLVKSGRWNSFASEVCEPARFCEKKNCCSNGVRTVNLGNSCTSVYRITATIGVSDCFSCKLFQYLSFVISIQASIHEFRLFCRHNKHVKYCWLSSFRFAVDIRVLFSVCAILWRMCLKIVIFHFW